MASAAQLAARAKFVAMIRSKKKSGAALASSVPASSQPMKKVSKPMNVVPMGIGKGMSHVAEAETNMAMTKEKADALHRKGHH